MTSRPGIGRLIRAVAVAGGIWLLLIAATDPYFRDSSGALRGSACVPLALGAGLWVIAAAARTPLRASGAWLALALAGQAATWQLIVAGPVVRYQHYVAPGDLSRQIPGWILGILLLQAVAVATGLWRRRSALWWVFRDGARPWQWFLLAGLLFLFAAAPSRHLEDYGVELGWAFTLALVNLANAGLAAAALPADRLAGIRRVFTRILGEPTHRRPRPDRFVLAAAAWVVLAGVLLNVFVYQRHPHVPDEVSYLYQARYFAHGMLEMPAPPVPEGFDLDLMEYEPDRWYSPVPPGWPLALAIGSRFGVPGLVNPILAGLAILLAYLLTWDLYDRRVARATVLLLATSPWLLFMAMSYMTHLLSLVCALGAAWLVRSWLVQGRVHRSWSAGLLLGAVGLVRPLEAVVTGLLLGAWLLTRRGWRARAAGVTAFGLGAAMTAAVLLPYNRHFTGSPTTFPIMSYADARYGPGTNSLGFGANRGLGWTGLDPLPGHGPIDAALNTVLNSFAVNVDFLGWGSGSLLFLFALLAMGRRRRSDRLLLAVILAVMGVHALYWFGGGPDFGARYWFLILVPCAALTARGIQELSNKVAWGPRAGVLAVFLGITAFVTFLPWRAIDKYYHYRGMRPGIAALAHEHGFGSSLVLVRGRRHPDYASAAIYNPLDLRAATPIFAWDRDARVRRRLLAAYPDRPVYVVTGPTLTGDGYRLEAGPLPPNDPRLLGAPGSSKTGDSVPPPP
ncbi:MAG: ArnT family glycosyltransferase [Gemmatimonadota bacterium]